jgi:hypothetical protein
MREMNRVSWHRTILSTLMGCGLAIGGCTAQLGSEELDPAASLADEGEWWDEGPPPGEEAAEPTESDPGEGGVGTLSSALTGAPRFQLPFPCGQVWAGQTRSNHSPSRAVDFNRSNDIGDTVVAAAAGTVTRVDNEGNVSYGRWIEIDHGNGYRTRYAHLSVQAVRVGQHVRKGQRIGNVGDTGGSTGPHLHFELRHWGTAIRPVFNGRTAHFWGTRNYTSQNSCGGSSNTVVGRVNTAGAPLNIRAGASTRYRAVGSVADGARVRIRCQKRGQSIRGTYGTSTLWDYIGSGYVSDAYVSTGSDGQIAPTCH